MHTCAAIACAARAAWLGDFCSEVACSSKLLSCKLSRVPNTSGINPESSFCRLCFEARSRGAAAELGPVCAVFQKRLGSVAAAELGAALFATDTNL